MPGRGFVILKPAAVPACGSDKYQADLAADALIRGVSNETGGEDDSMLQPALEMALQKYTPRTAAVQ